MSTLPVMLQEPWPAGAALAASVAQVVVARRVDLGPLTVGLVAIAVLLGVGSGVGAGLLATAGALASAAWFRAARAGVGRPELTGLTLAVALAAHLAEHAFPAQVPSGATLGAVVLVSLVGLGLAFERRGPAGQRVYLYRDVPVRERRESS